MENLSLYLHIPFCKKKCSYCDFLSAPCGEETRQAYVEALCREIVQRAKKEKDRKIDTVFFGGGTPSLLSSGQITEIMTVLRGEFCILPEAEISLEMNPESVEREKLKTYRELGINRLSLGLQSADDEELKVLGRIHTWERFQQAWNMVREAGFSNVNIDLMAALPGQSAESYEKTLQKVLALQPEHISAYSLIVEEGTLFYEWYVEGKKEGLPDEDTDRKMYEMTRTQLSEKGYYRYEISNYAKKGYECRHNAGYWKRKEYLGLGLGASSLLGEIRSTNLTDLERYLKEEKCWTEEMTQLSEKEQMEEFMFLGLRMMEGISPVGFEKKFHRPLSDIYGKQIEKLLKQGLLDLDQNTGNYVLTLHGIDVSNRVFTEFV